MSKYFGALEQAELFESSQSTPFEKTRRRTAKMDFLSHYYLRVRLDKILIVFIVFIIAGVFIYSMGVEKGKRVVRNETVLKNARLQKEIKLPVQLAAKAGTSTNTMPLVVAASGTLPTILTAPNGANQKSVPIQIETDVKAISQALKDAQTELTETQRQESSVKRNYTIQMVTYKKESQAKELIQSLVKKGHEAFVIPSGQYIQVCLASFESRQNADKTLLKLKADGIVPRDAFVRSIPR